MNWQLIDNNEMERIHVREMHRDFPPGELKGVDVMERLRADGCYWPYACYDEAGRLLAYAFLCGLPGEPNVLLDYYAVLPAVRCRGLGAELLARLRGVCAGRWQGILIEAEDPAEAPDAEVGKPGIRRALPAVLPALRREGRPDRRGRCPGGQPCPPVPRDGARPAVRPQCGLLAGGRPAPRLWLTHTRGRLPLSFGLFFLYNKWL